MRILFSLAFLSIGFYGCLSKAAPLKPVPVSKAQDVRRASAVVSKSLYAKLKSQARAEALAELSRETEARERAKLEALQELDAGASDGTSTDSTDN